MANQYLLNEDNLPPKLPVIFSEEIINEIEVIKEYNQFEKEGLIKLDSYIKWIGNHISNRAIAFDYGNNFRRESDGTTTIYDMGVSFCVKEGTDGTFIEISWLHFNLEEFGLEIPVWESKQYNRNRMKHSIHLIESDLKRMIDESVKRVLAERRNHRLNEAVSRSFRRVLREHITRNR